MLGPGGDGEGVGERGVGGEEDCGDGVGFGAGGGEGWRGGAGGGLGFDLSWDREWWWEGRLEGRTYIDFRVGSMSACSSQTVS